MSSHRQKDANRRNALKSTGPTTVEGKLRSRSNAVRHGLTAETVIATMEDIDDYEAFEATVIADYDAETAVERELVLRIASVLWRLRRSTLIETALFETAVENSRGKTRNPRNRLLAGRTSLQITAKCFCRHRRKQLWRRELEQNLIQKGISPIASCISRICRKMLTFV